MWIKNFPYAVSPSMHPIPSLPFSSVGKCCLYHCLAIENSEPHMKGRMQQRFSPDGLAWTLCSVLWPIHVVQYTPSNLFQSSVTSVRPACKSKATDTIPMQYLSGSTLIDFPISPVSLQRKYVKLCIVLSKENVTQYFVEPTFKLWDTSNASSIEVFCCLLCAGCLVYSILASDWLTTLLLQPIARETLYIQ